PEAAGGRHRHHTLHRGGVRSPGRRRLRRTLGGNPMTESGPLLRVTGVHAGYRRGNPVVHDVSLAVDAGAALGIVGESGSGKSTLAKVLVGQLRPAAGRVDLAGTPVGSLGRTARRAIQLVPQDPFASLDPRMSIGDAIAEAI